MFSYVEFDKLIPKMYREEQFAKYNQILQKSMVETAPKENGT